MEEHTKLNDRGFGQWIKEKGHCVATKKNRCR